MRQTKKRSRKCDLLMLAGLLLVVGGLCLNVGRTYLRRADEIRQDTSPQSQDGSELKRLFTQGTYLQGIGEISLISACVLGIAGVAILVFRETNQTE